LFVDVHLKVLYHTGDYSGIPPLSHTEIWTENGHDLSAIKAAMEINRS
jgi:hypothetical protein